MCEAVVEGMGDPDELDLGSEKLVGLLALHQHLGLAIFVDERDLAWTDTDHFESRDLRPLDLIIVGVLRPYKPARDGASSDMTTVRVRVRHAEQFADDGREFL